MKLEKQAVDLTALAIGLVALGIVTAIGSSILIATRDSRLTSLPVVTTLNETITPTAGSCQDLAHTWAKSLISVSNATGPERVTATNYSTSINSDFGTLNICANAGTYSNQNWNVSYTWYNTSRADWTLPNNASIGLGEYGNWFKIIVIVGIAAVVLAVIFMSFGKRGSESGEIGGTY